MPKNILFLIVSGFFVSLCSCHKTCKIPKEDSSFIPYHGKETLIFHSSKGSNDTIFLQGVNTFNSLTDQWSLFAPDAEYKIILAKVSDFNGNGKKRYLDSVKFFIFENAGETKLDLHFAANDSWFYCDSTYSKQTLTNALKITLNISGRLYKDVVILTPNKRYQEKYNGAFIDRPNTIYKIYWSIKEGIVRYDKRNENWELISKI